MSLQGSGKAPVSAVANEGTEDPGICISNAARLAFNVLNHLLDSGCSQAQIRRWLDEICYLRQEREYAVHAQNNGNGPGLLNTVGLRIGSHGDGLGQTVHEHQLPNEESQSHDGTVHSSNADPKYPCPRCKVSKSRKALKRHIEQDCPETESPLLTWICPDCRKTETRIERFCTHHENKHHCGHPCPHAEAALRRVHPRHADGCPYCVAVFIQDLPAFVQHLMNKHYKGDPSTLVWDRTTLLKSLLFRGDIRPIWLQLCDAQGVSSESLKWDVCDARDDIETLEKNETIEDLEPRLLRLMAAGMPNEMRLQPPFHSRHRLPDTHLDPWAREELPAMFGLDCNSMHVDAASRLAHESHLSAIADSSADTVDSYSNLPTLYVPSAISNATNMATGLPLQSELSLPNLSDDLMLPTAYSISMSPMPNFVDATNPFAFVGGRTQLEEVSWELPTSSSSPQTEMSLEEPDCDTDVQDNYDTIPQHHRHPLRQDSSDMYYLTVDPNPSAGPSSHDRRHQE